MSKKSRFFGELPALYNFFLNPYTDARFTRCPQCDGKTGQKKVPLMIHVDPLNPINLNYTCRYCPKCDLLIAHKDEIKFYLEKTFSGHNTELNIADYFVMGTTEHAYWKDGLTNPHFPSETLANLHGFKQYLNFKRIGGWSFDSEHESKPSAQPEEEPDDVKTGTIDNVNEALKLLDKIKSHLPISVRPSRELINMLRRQGVNIDRYKPLTIHSVLYMGDEGGITCDITPKGREDTPVLCSLTQLEIIGDDPLAKEIKTYQQKRAAKLALKPERAPIGFTINPKKIN